MVAAGDRFGIGWRPALAAGILSNLDRLDVVEVIADDWFDRSRSELAALEMIARHVPITLHGVAMGLASAAPVETKRIDRLARLVARLQPLAWSEHLAFVRGGGIELGHLAAPPRTEATIEGACANIARAAAIAGARPILENVATLIDPPASRFGEAEWITAVLENTGANMLLDLHNLYANAVNFGKLAPAELLAKMPLGRVRAVHLAGGRWIRSGDTARLLDDHLHAVPDPVFALLEELGARIDHPLEVVIERDEHYPPIEVLLAELDRARAALARGRARREAA